MEQLDVPATVQKIRSQQGMPAEVEGDDKELSGKTAAQLMAEADQRRGGKSTTEEAMLSFWGTLETTVDAGTKGSVQSEFNRLQQKSIVQGRSQLDALADFAGVHSSVLDFVERGGMPPSVESLAAWLEFRNIDTAKWGVGEAKTVAELFHEVAPPRRRNPAPRTPRAQRRAPCRAPPAPAALDGWPLSLTHTPSFCVAAVGGRVRAADGPAAARDLGGEGAPPRHGRRRRHLAGLPPPRALRDKAPASSMRFRRAGRLAKLRSCNRSRAANRRMCSGEARGGRQRRLTRARARQLYETKQKFCRDGRTRPRNRPLAEKVRPGESVCRPPSPA